MADINNPNLTADPNRPRMVLTKIKRPVRKIMPQNPVPNQVKTSNEPAASNPIPSTPTATPNIAQVASPFMKPETQPLATPEIEEVHFSVPNETQNSSMDAFDLDAYLDEGAQDDFAEELDETAPVKFDPKNPRFLGAEEIEVVPVKRFVDEEPDHFDSYDEEAPAGIDANSPLANPKILIAISVVVFLAGALISRLIFSEQKVVRNGLQGVVVNQEVPKGRARCGVAEKTQGCVLYIMNPQRQELNARDFYDLASQLTGRQRFVIETGNMRYSNVKIRPGDIAQLNIPPL